MPKISVVDKKIFPCPACFSHAAYIDTLDFNKSCRELDGVFLPLSGIGVDYHFCDNCHFCFSPTIYAWDTEQFEEKIYNDSYFESDPQAIEIRPNNFAKLMMNLFKKQTDQINHLDYGGGAGRMSAILQANQWKSLSYDPFWGSNSDASSERFNFITAFEVFEHAKDINEMMSEITELLDENGLIMFSTSLSNEHIKRGKKLDWWYASPRNGHISLHSKMSLTILAHRYGFKFGSISSQLHIMFRQMPIWAEESLVPKN